MAGRLMGSLKTLLSLSGSEGKAIEGHRDLGVSLRVGGVEVWLVLDIAATKQSEPAGKEGVISEDWVQLAPPMSEGPISRDARQLS